jgi:hypothetical protein
MVPGTSGGRRAWLSLTPEPERELPVAIATLHAGGQPDEGAIERERHRLETLVVRGRRRGWFAYLGRALELAEDANGNGQDPAVQRARELVIDVLHNHHQLVLGVDPDAADHTAGERARLEKQLAKGDTG